MTLKYPIILALLLCTYFFSSAQNIFRTACQGNLNRLDSLLQHHSIDIKDNNGMSLLHWSVGCKQKEIFNYLIKKGLDVNKENNQKRIPMHVAIHYDVASFFDTLIELQPNNNWINTYGGSLLEKAVLMNRGTFITKLVNNGVDIDATNNRGSTPLELSQRMNLNETSKLLLSLGADQTKVRTFKMTGKYMGQPEPVLTPKLFAPNFISTEEQEFSCCFNAEGTEFFFGVDMGGRNEIRYTKMTDSIWSKPKVLLTHETFGYNDPFLSPDENKLYFISSQTLDGTGKPKDIDIWYIERTKNGWSPPINAGTNINTKGNEYYISFTNEGTMYFSSDGHSDKTNTLHDIYSSKNENGKFQKPIRLGNAINTAAYEADVFISPDESYIIFCSERENGFGRGDLYISFKNEDHTWTPSVNMGDKINSANYEYCPFVSKDGKYLFYTSNQDIYWVSTEILNTFKN